MVLRVLLIFGFALLYSLQSASAETACKTIDKVLHSVSLLRGIQYDQSDRNYSNSILELELFVDQISLPVLIPIKSREELPSESEAIYQYVSNIREAVAGAKAGYEEYAKQSLMTGIPDEFAGTLATLENFWNCVPEEEMPSSGADFQSVTPAYTGASGVGFEKIPIEFSSPSSGNSNIHGKLSSNGKALQKVVFDASVLKGSARLLILFLLLILGGVVYFVRKRSKTFAVREQRRLLHMTAKVRIGQTSYPMVIVDISMNGLKIKHDGKITQRRTLKIQLNGAWHIGYIKWKNDLFAGIAFKKPLDKQTLTSVVNSIELV